MLFLLFVAYLFYKLLQIIDHIENSAEDSMFFFSRNKHNKID